MFNKHFVKTNNTISKNFDYSKGNCNLKFQLRTDIKQELKDFLELLEISVVEVHAELNKK